MLRLLEVEHGQRVLEVDTGSGFTTALLSHLVGSEGVVSSVDIDQEMTERAARLLARDTRANVVPRSGDGRIGSAAYAPFDRVVAWAAASVLPRAWREQTRMARSWLSPCDARVKRGRADIGTDGVDSCWRNCAYPVALFRRRQLRYVHGKAWTRAARLGPRRRPFVDKSAAPVPRLCHDDLNPYNIMGE
jgi:SAM-dependent methyltransferase